MFSKDSENIQYANFLASTNDFASEDHRQTYHSTKHGGLRNRLIHQFLFASGLSSLPIAFVYLKVNKASLVPGLIQTFIVSSLVGLTYGNKAYTQYQAEIEELGGHLRKQNEGKYA